MTLERIVIILLGISLVAIGVTSRNVEKQLDRERTFWRTMYASAEKDAKFKRCLELDDNFVICEKE